MKIRVFSDIHWEFQMKIKMEQDQNYKFWEPIHLDDDINTTLILAGDLWNGLKSIDQIQEFHHRFARVIVVVGNHDCVSADTELLTKRGFVHYTDIKQTDEVLTLDKAGFSVWNKINDIIIKPYIGKMFTLNKQKLEFDVTPTHRLFFSKERGSENIYQFANDVKSARMYIPISGHSYNKEYPISDNELELIGLCITDGSIKNDKIDIYQSKYDIVERIRYLLGELGILYSENCRVRDITHICGKKLIKPTKPSYHFYLSKIESKKLLQYNISKTSFPEMFSKLSERQFSILLKGICLGDGTVIQDTMTIYKDKFFLERLQILCVQFGYKAILKSYRETHWKLYVNKTEKLQYTPKTDIIETEYSGDVWCLNVDNSNFMVRKNGKCHFTGNCWNYKFFQTLADDYKDELEFRNMSNVFLLDRDMLEIGSDIFVGCSLYTNMDNSNPLVMMNAPQLMYPDFQYTITGETFDEHYVYRKIKLTPEDWVTKNKLDFEYIQYIVANNKDKNIHVVTHHGCSFQSVHEKYKGYGMSNYYFVSDYDQYIFDNPNIKTWIHGHVHNCFNYYIGECQVIVNPRGYATQNGIENKEFDEVSLFDI